MYWETSVRLPYNMNSKMSTYFKAIIQNDDRNLSTSFSFIYQDEHQVFSFLYVVRAFSENLSLISLKISQKIASMFLNTFSKLRCDFLLKELSSTF